MRLPWYQIRDRYTFGRFLGLHPEDRVPDARTIWRFREGLKSSGVFESLYAELSSQIENQGYVARKGQIVDASIVAAPRQRNSLEDNAKVKRGEVPEDWSLNKRRHKDVEARWTCKHGENHYGYKNHISMDRGYGLVRCWEVTDAARHDSQVLEQVLDKKNTHGDVWADSAYRSVEQERLLEAGGWRSHIHRKGYRNRPLGERAREENRERSKVRAAVEHVFAHQEAMGGQADQEGGSGSGTNQDRHDELGVQPAPARMASGATPPGPPVRGGLNIGESAFSFRSNIRTRPRGRRCSLSFPSLSERFPVPGISRTTMNNAIDSENHPYLPSDVTWNEPPWEPRKAVISTLPCQCSDHRLPGSIRFPEAP